MFEDDALIKRLIFAKSVWKIKFVVDNQLKHEEFKIRQSSKRVHFHLWLQWQKPFLIQSTILFLKQIAFFLKINMNRDKICNTFRK